jgi:hypothetical protein
MKQSEVYRQNAENTRDRGCSAHPVFPAPSVFEEGKRSKQISGAMRREIANVCRYSGARVARARNPFGLIVGGRVDFGFAPSGAPRNDAWRKLAP